MIIQIVADHRRLVAVGAEDDVADHEILDVFLMHLLHL